MDGLFFERVCWIAAYCASLAGQRASEGADMGDGCLRIVDDNEVRGQATADARKAVEAMRSV